MKSLTVSGLIQRDPLSALPEKPVLEVPSSPGMTQQKTSSALPTKPVQQVSSTAGMNLQKRSHALPDRPVPPVPNSATLPDIPAQPETVTSPLPSTTAQPISDIKQDAAFQERTRSPRLPPKPQSYQPGSPLKSPPHSTTIQRSSRSRNSGGALKGSFKSNSTPPSPNSKTKEKVQNVKKLFSF